MLTTRTTPPFWPLWFVTGGWHAHCRAYDHFDEAHLIADDDEVAMVHGGPLDAPEWIPTGATAASVYRTPRLIYAHRCGE